MAFFKQKDEPSKIYTVNVSYISLPFDYDRIKHIHNSRGINKITIADGNSIMKFRIPDTEFERLPLSLKKYFIMENM